MDNANNRNKELFTNSAIFAMGILGTKIIQFLLVPFYSSYMTTAQFGEADLIISSVSMMHPVLSLGIDQAIVRFGLTRKKGKGDVLRISINISLTGAFVLGILLLCFKKVEIIQKYAGAILVIYLGIAISSVLSNYCKVLEKNRVYTLNSILHALIMCGLAVVTLVKFHAGIQGYLISVIGAYFFSIVFLIVSCRSFTDYFSSKMDRGLVRQMVQYSLPLVPNVLSWWVIQMSDRYMVAYFNGVSANGKYTMAYKIPSVFNLIVGIFMQAFDITVFKEVDRGIDKAYIEKIYKYYLSVTFLSGSLVMFLIRPISTLVLKGEFTEAWIYVPLLLLSYVVANLQSFYGVLYGGLKATNITFKTTMAGAICNVVLNLILIPEIGPMGAAVATLASYFVVYIMRVFMIKPLLAINPEFRRIGLSIAIMFLQTVLYMTNRPQTTFACCFIPVMLTVLYFRELSSIIKKVMEKVR